MAKKDANISEVTLLAAAFVRWGLGLFLLGLIMGYAPLVHYLQSTLEGHVGVPLANLTLWLGCPYAVQIGALGMIAIGAVYGLFPADELEAERRDYTALWLCIGGLIAILITGYVGYFVLNTIWRALLGTQPARETVWLYALSLSAATYLIGVALAYVSIVQITYYKAKH
ncbi:MAG TPA: hypothetical protein VMW57_10925 [Methyloceanibacter sp.]|nr:hypothetical protein [Methyloceanibacter sp.]